MTLNDFQARWQAELDQLATQDALRHTRGPLGAIDLSSNDYLGLGRDLALRNQVIEAWQALGGRALNGATGSRLLTGHNDLVEALEADIARWHGAEAALLYSSGYQANLGLLSGLNDRNQVILYDQFVHASLRDGLRLRLGGSFPFAHNDLNQLEDKLKQYPGALVLTETVFSMDGDLAPLDDLAGLCRRYGTLLLLDEAHGLGVLGEAGMGLWTQAYADVTLARVYPYGKAMGGHGAAVVGSRVLKQWLLNKSRPQIFSTAVPPVQVLHLQYAYPRLRAADAERAQLRALAQAFVDAAVARSWAERIIHPYAAIAGLRAPGNEAALQLAADLQARGYDIRAIRYPSVPRGAERLRICLHAFNTAAEVQGVFE
jgi:8-amino-7-oxononanoate synthase